MIFLLLTITLTLALVSCNDIAEDNRWIYQGTVVLTDTSAYARNVLIEDFTGQRCVNCPKASAVIDTLQMQLNNDSVQRVVAVAIHGGSMSIPEPAGLATTQGVNYHTACGIPSWPKGLINKKGALAEYTEWKALTIPYLSMKSDYAISGTLSVNENDSVLIHIHVLSTLNSQPSTAKIGVWITEDSIVKPQLMPEGGMNMNYVHKHVFRYSFTDMNGDGFQLNSLGTYDTMYACKRSDTWNKNQLHAVVFVANDQEVLQVNQFKINKQ